jgi:hypothetical protein
VVFILGGFLSVKIGAGALARKAGSFYEEKLIQENEGKIKNLIRSTN